MNSYATRMGSETLGYTAPRRDVLGQTESFWGSLPQGVKTIIKVAVVAVVAYAAVSFAMPYLLEVPAINSVFYSISSAVSGIGSALMTGVNSVLTFFGAAPIGAALIAPGSAAAAAVTSGTSTVAAVAAGATTLTAAKAAAINTASLAPAPDTSLVPDMSSNVAAIDPSQTALLSKKTGLAANAAAFDLPEITGTEHAHGTHYDSGKAAKLGQEAVEISEHNKRHAASTRDHISQAENKLKQWAERVGGHKTADTQTSHADAVRQRESTFANELNNERARLEQALDGPSV